MAFTLSQLSAIEAAIGSGQLSISYDGKTVTYRNMADLQQAREMIRNDLLASGVLAAAPLTNRGPGALTYFSRD